MNQNKKANGWILCSSKSFPGKYYYFNVLNGETAWTLTEAEMEKTKNQVHSNYPEPSDKPPEESHFSSLSQPKTPATHLGSKQPYYGEICFRPFMPTIDLLKCVWAPVPIMYLNERGNPCFEVQKSNTSWIDLTNERNQSIEDNNRIIIQVHTCNDQYVSKRFVTYKNSTNSQENNQMDKKNTDENPFRMSPSIQVPVQPKPLFSFGENNHQFYNGTPNTFQTTKNSENNRNQYLISPNFAFNSTNNNTEHEKVTFNVQLPTNNQTKLSEGLNNLAESDLRHILLQRKRKLENSKNNDENAKKMKASCSEKQISPKKHVTFKLQCSEDILSNISMSDEQVIETPPSPTVETITSLRRLGATDHTWYIVIDFDVLLEHFDYIDDYIKNDPQCCILIPYSVYKELTTTSTACGPHTRVNAARNVLRRLGCRNARHRVQKEENYLEKFKSQKDQIQCCCLELIRNNIHVVLITNNNILYREAKEKRIHVFKMNQIQNGELKTADLIFDVRKIKVHLPNPDCVPNSMENNVANTDSQYGINKNVANERKEQSTENKCKNFVQNFWSGDDSDSCSLTTFSQETINQNTTEKPSELNSKEQIIQEDESVANILKKTINFLNKPQNNGNEKQRSMFAIEANFMPLTPKNIENYLKNFNLKNKMVEDILKNNSDERVCCFRQIMENLADILQEPSSKAENSRLCVLYNILQRIRKTYRKHKSIGVVIEKLQMLLYNRTGCFDKIRSDLLPIEIFQAIACGLLLVNLLQVLIPTSDHLIEIEKGLNDLIVSIENPNNLDFVCTEIKIPTLKEYLDNSKEIETEIGSRYEQNDINSNIIQYDSGIIRYLKRHYPAWKDFDETTTCFKQTPEIKIFRTFGRDLHQIKLNSKSGIITEEANKRVESNSEQNTVQLEEIDGIKTGKSVRDGNTVFQNKGIETKKKNEQVINKNEKANKMAKLLKKYDSENELKGLKETEKTEPRVINACSNDKLEEKTNFQLNKTDLVNGLKNTEDTEPKIIRQFSNDKGIEKTNFNLKNTNFDTKFDLNQIKHENTFGTIETDTKVVRNIAILPEYDYLFKNSVLNRLQDYEISICSNSEKHISENTLSVNSKNDSKYDMYGNASKISDNTTKIKEYYDGVSSIDVDFDLVESSLRTISNKSLFNTKYDNKTLMKRQFEALTACFHDVIKFIFDCMQEQKDNKQIKPNEKKARKVHVHMERIIQSLSTIYSKIKEDNSNILVTKSRELVSMFITQANNLDKALINICNSNE